MKIGLGLPMIDGEGGLPAYAQIRDFAQQAEALGVDSLWAYDHLLYNRAGERWDIYECWTLLAALAEATTRVELGTLVLCTAFRNPALLAKMAATLDAVSNGRLILGLGAGWLKDEFDAFGLPFAHKVDRFAEALEIIVPLLRTGQVDFQGTYFSAPSCELRPRGPRPQGPPILVGAFGPRMLGLTARHADLWNTCWLGRADALREPLAALHAACAREGRDPASVGVTVGVAIAYPPEATPGGADDLLRGSPQEVAAELRAFAALGVSHAICRFMPTTHDLAALSWFAEVLRHYRQP